MTLGDIIKEYRNSNNLSMDAFSERSGISKAYISLLERNKHPQTGKPIAPSIQCIKQAAKGMRMDFNVLFSKIDGNVSLNDTLIDNPSISEDEHGIKYEVFEQLLQKYDVTPYKVAKEAGVTQTALSNWKLGKSTPTTQTLQKIADYFGVTIDYLMTGKEEPEKKEIMLTPRDERDIKKDLDSIMEKIEAGEDSPLYYNGEEVDRESMELLRDAIGMSLRHLKIINKEKYNPHKNKK